MIKKIIILLIFCFCPLAVNSVHAYNYNAVTYYNKGVEYSMAGNYQSAIDNYKKAVKYDPDFASAYYNMGVCYNNLKKQFQAVESYKKALKYDPHHKDSINNLSITYYDIAVNAYNSNLYSKALRYLNLSIAVNKDYTDVYNLMAFCYLKTNDYDRAIDNFQKFLNYNPNNPEAQNNIKYASRLKKDSVLTAKINSLYPVQYTPAALKNLVSMQTGITTDSMNKTYQILDLLWGDIEGQRLLNVVISNNIPITLTYGSGNTNAQTQIKESKHYLTFIGIPLFSFNNKREKNISVNIGVDHVKNFYNKELTPRERIYALHVFVHEFCHAAKNTVAETPDNSIQEELYASMIGYNITSRLIKGRNLTPDEAYDYSKDCLKAILSDDHRYLPLYNNFENEIRQVNVYPPHIYRYQNLVELYKQVRNDQNTKRLDKLEAMIVPN